MRVFESLTLTLLSITAVEATAQDAPKFGVQCRVGYNIGATAPLSMPAEIREINGYSPGANGQVGVDVCYSISERFGLGAGLSFQTKGMTTEASVTSYQMVVSQGTAQFSGVFTGDNYTQVCTKNVALRVVAAYSPWTSFRVGIGPYLSYLADGEFEGHAYNGYLRIGGPTGSRVNMGNDASTWGAYSFDKSVMNSIQLGAYLSVEWFFVQHFGAYASLDWSFTPLFKSTFTTVPQKLYPIYGSVGLMYRL